MTFTPGRLLGALGHILAGAQDPPVTGLCVALSGGLDSTVLLTALAGLRREGRLGWPLRACHVDHALHPDSADWASACARLAATLDVSLQAATVDARPAPGESPEAAARSARYAALRDALAPGEVLLTAHHADDQWETILLQSLRGGGLQAVAGMPPLRRFGAGWHARPLLPIPREALHAWAVAGGVRWLEDPSNRDPAFDRNYLRQAVLPALRTRWPAAARAAGRIAGFAQEALALERETAAADLATAREGLALRLAALRELPAARQRFLLRAWLQSLRLPVPPARTLEALMHDVRAAAADRVPETRWPGAVVRRYRDRLHAEPAHGQALREGPWCLAQDATWPLDGEARLERVAATGEGLSQARSPARVQVVLRPPGAAFAPAGSAHRRPLRKWFQEQGVLPWRRAAIPLLCADGEIVAVGDLACAAAYAAQPGEPSWRIAWRGRPLVTEAEALAFNWRDHPPFT